MGKLLLKGGEAVLCPICQREYKSVRTGCPVCGKGEAVRRSSYPLAEAAPPIDDEMRTEWNGETYTQYYRESLDLPPARRERRHARAEQDTSPGKGGAARAEFAPLGSSGRSEPPEPLWEEEPAVERKGRVYGPEDMPSGPIYVRRPQERPMRASLQRKVQLRRRGPRLGIILLSVLLVLVVAAGTAGYFLTQSSDGQMLMAVWGWSNAPNEAYWRLGEIKLRDGLMDEALENFMKASEADEKNGIYNVEGKLNIATAYERTGRQPDAIAIYQEIKDKYPERIESYQRMYYIYKDEGEHSKAIAMLEEGRDKTKQDVFTRMIKEYAPDPPYASEYGERFTMETQITLKSVEGTIIKYTLDTNPISKETKATSEPSTTSDPAVTPEPDPMDPLLYGKVYEGEEILFGEGTTRLRAVAVQQNGVPSKELDEVYTVIFPTPNAPKANVASGEYERPPNVSLVKEKGIVEIHYTIDGSQATPASPLYTGPIRLPLGKSTLRAIAIDHRGKVSYEMSVSYKVKGAVKLMFRKEDVFDKLALMKTTYEQFERAYGKPKKFEQIDIGGPADLFRAEYNFGYASFIQVDASGKKVLYELSVESGNITGPRKISIGDSESKVISAFRDMGGQANERGERTLYNNGMDSIGTYKLGEDGNFAAHYYYPRDKNDYVELSFYFQNDKVVRMYWLRYTGDAT